MKLLLLILLTPIFTFAQVVGNGSGITTDTQAGIVFREVPIEGTPFVNPIYKEGETIINGNSKTKALMRYNAYYDSIELLDENGVSRKLLRRKSIEANFDGKTYKIFNYSEAGKVREAYFNPLNEGEIMLLFRPKKLFVQAEKPEDGYDKYDPPTYKDVSSYFIRTGDSPATKTKLSKKQILKHLNKNIAEVKKYMAMEKLDLKKESDVIKLIDYYNSLVPHSSDNGT